MKVLVFNSGSSSIKYELFDMRSRTSPADGLLERIGEPGSRLVHRSHPTGPEASELVSTEPVADHREAIRHVNAMLQQSQALSDSNELSGIGHRVVHGGEEFREPTLIDSRVVESIRSLIPLAPLHNPVNLMGIEVMLAEFPNVPQVAVFDTAFHQTLPDYAYRYAVPQKWYDKHRIRRYGFHGTSHQYVAKQAAAYLGRPLHSLNLIVLHLGNGVSAAAIRGGQSVDTSMGLTPLAGLMMGTRCGDIDPAVIFHIAKESGESINERTIHEIDSMLNKDSGLKGIAGVNDMREVLRLRDQGDKNAELAIQMYTYRIKKYVGAYFAVLGRIDAVVFTAGIGENSSEIRKLSCAGLEGLGIILDSELNDSNARGSRAIQAGESRIKLLVIPTDEELEIADQTAQCIAARNGQSSGVE